MDWGELLDPAHGGPGEPPGRAEAVAEAKVLTAERYRVHGFKRAKGSSKARKGDTASRNRLRDQQKAK